MQRGLEQFWKSGLLVHRKNASLEKDVKIEQETPVFTKRLTNPNTPLFHASVIVVVVQIRCHACFWAFPFVVVVVVAGDLMTILAIQRNNGFVACHTSTKCNAVPCWKCNIMTDKPKN